MWREYGHADLAEKQMALLSVVDYAPITTNIGQQTLGGRHPLRGFEVLQGCRKRVRRGSGLIRRLRWSEAMMISSLPMRLESECQFSWYYCVEGSSISDLGLEDHIDPVAPIV